MKPKTLRTLLLYFTAQRRIALAVLRLLIGRSSPSEALSRLSRIRQLLRLQRLGCIQSEHGLLYYLERGPHHTERDVTICYDAKTRRLYIQSVTYWKNTYI